MSNRNSIINKTKPSNRLPFENNWVQTVKPNVPRVKSFFALGRGQKHKTWCFSQVKHRTDLKNISEAMNFDDGDSYTHFCYAKSSKKGTSSKTLLMSFVWRFFFCVFLRQNAVWRHRFFDVFFMTVGWPFENSLVQTVGEDILIQTVKPHALWK